MGSPTGRRLERIKGGDRRFEGVHHWMLDGLIVGTPPSFLPPFLSEVEVVVSCLRP